MSYVQTIFELHLSTSEAPTERWHSCKGHTLEDGYTDKEFYLLRFFAALSSYFNVYVEILSVPCLHGIDSAL